jgi:CRISPR-associated protein Cas2
MLPRSLWIAAYDVREAKRLRLALQVLKGYATGGQKSVFECFLTEAERRRLLGEIAAVLAAEDSFLMVRLDPRSRIRTLGRGVAPQDPPFFYVD